MRGIREHFVWVDSVHYFDADNKINSAENYPACISVAGWINREIVKPNEMESEESAWQELNSRSPKNRNTIQFDFERNSTALRVHCKQIDANVIIMSHNSFVFDASERERKRIIINSVNNKNFLNSLSLSLPMRLQFQVHIPHSAPFASHKCDQKR